MFNSDTPPNDENGKPFLFYLMHDDKLLVAVTQEHETVFGEGYEPKGAARVFWLALQKNVPADKYFACRELDRIAGSLLSRFPENTIGWTVLYPITIELRSRARDILGQGD